jgi:hypothetical protein
MSPLVAIKKSPTPVDVQAVAASSLCEVVARSRVWLVDDRADARARASLRRHDSPEVTTTTE